MGMLERYKKTGGFAQLLGVLEGCGPEKREKFLSLIKEESPIWEETLQKKLIRIEQMANWPERILEILTVQLKALSLAGLIKGSNEELRLRIEKVLPYSQKRKIDGILNEKEFTKAEIASVFEKLPSEIRLLEKEGFLKLQEINPELEVPAKIEEFLEKNDFTLLSLDSQEKLSPQATSEQTKKTLDAVKPKTNHLNLPKEASVQTLIAENKILKSKLTSLVEDYKKLELENKKLKESLAQYKGAS